MCFCAHWIVFLIFVSFLWWICIARNGSIFKQFANSCDVFIFCVFFLSGISQWSSIEHHLFVIVNLKQLSSLYVLFYCWLLWRLHLLVKKETWKVFASETKDHFKNYVNMVDYCFYRAILMPNFHASWCVAWMWWHLKEFIQACRSKPMANESDSLGYCGQGRVAFFRASDKWTLIGK